MDVTYSYKPIGESYSEPSISDDTPSIEVISEDMDLLKAAARLHLKTLKPTSRMEIIARAFGFRTAAALQTAMRSATPDAPLVLTPCVGTIDAYRLEQLTALSRDMKLGHLDRKVREPHPEFDQARNIAGAAVSHIRATRGVSDDFSLTGYSPRNRACVIHGLPGRPCRHIVEDLIPQIDLCLNPASSVRDEDFLSDGRIPKGGAIHMLGGALALDPDTHKEIAAKFEVSPSRIMPKAKFEKHLAQGTLVYEAPDTKPAAFMTATFGQRFADEDIGLIHLEETYGLTGSNTEWNQLCEMAQAATADIWQLDVTINDIGFAPDVDNEAASRAIHHGLSQMINELLMSMAFTAREGAEGKIEIGVETRVDLACAQHVEIWTIDRDLAEMVDVLNDIVRDHDVGETEVAVQAFSEEVEEYQEWVEEERLSLIADLDRRRMKNHPT